MVSPIGSAMKPTNVGSIGRGTAFQHMRPDARLAAGLQLRARNFAGRHAHDPEEDPKAAMAGERLKMKMKSKQKIGGPGGWMGLTHPDMLDPKMAEKAAVQLLKNPRKAAEIMQKLPEDSRRAVALSWALTELEDEFHKADQDRDGKLTFYEFQKWVKRVIEEGQNRDAATRPTTRQLIFVFISTTIPYIGFGMVDNGLMVIFGDQIDATLGVMFGASMLASAALGNAISNIFGMLLHGTITRFATKLGLPNPNLTLAQRKLPVVHSWTTAGSTVGVFVGCLLGMLPLLVMDQKKNEADRSNAKMAEEAKSA